MKTRSPAILVVCILVALAILVRGDAVDTTSGDTKTEDIIADGVVSLTGPLPIWLAQEQPYRRLAERYPTILEPADWTTIPFKYHCGDYSLTIPNSASEQTADVVLYPDDIKMFAAEGKNAWEYSITFDRSCSKVFYVTTEDQNGEQGFSAYDIHSKTTTRYTIDPSAFAPDIVMILGEEEYYPTLGFIYPLRGPYLLLSFSNPTTGADTATNMSSQAIYNTDTREIFFISLGGGTVPLLLDYGRDRLIMPLQSVQFFGPAHPLVEIDLAALGQ